MNDHEIYDTLPTVNSLHPTAVLPVCLSHNNTAPKSIDKKKFEGTWLVNNDGQTAQVKFDDSGVAHVAGMEWDGEHFKIGDRVEMTIIEGVGNNFMNLRVEENGKWSKDYFFAQYMFSESGDLIVWFPDAKAFKIALNRKLITGTISKDNSSVTITSDATTLLKLLNKPEDLSLFDYQNPGVLRKISLPKD